MDKMINIEKIISTDGFSLADTTIHRTGYPKHTKRAIINDSIEQLNKCFNELKSHGIDVQKVELHKRAGWGLWYRENIHEYTSYTIPNEYDYYIDYDPSEGKDKNKAKIIDLIFDDEEYNEEVMDDLYAEIEHLTEESRVFIDMNNFLVDYIVTKDSASYSFDHGFYLHHQYGILIIDVDL